MKVSYILKELSGRPQTHPPTREPGAHEYSRLNLPDAPSYYLVIPGDRSHSQCYSPPHHPECGNCSDLPNRAIAISTATSKVTSRTAARKERTEMACDTIFTRGFHLSSTTLNEYGIDVRRSARTYLLCANRTKYEYDVVALMG
jgi:hypothetical protein